MHGFIKKLIVLPALAFCLFAGCSRPEEGSVEDTYSHPEEISGYGITLTKDSSPEEVAALLIKGLDNEDTILLKQLVAVKHEKKEMSAIYERYGKESPVTLESAANLAVKGWQMTYSFLAKGQTSITKTDIHGDTATVHAMAKGHVNFEDRYIRIKLIKEDGWWKVAAGIEG